MTLISERVRKALIPEYKREQKQQVGRPTTEEQGKKEQLSKEGKPYDVNMQELLDHKWCIVSKRHGELYELKKLEEAEREVEEIKKRDPQASIRILTSDSPYLKFEARRPAYNLIKYTAWQKEKLSSNLYRIGETEVLPI